MSYPLQLFRLTIGDTYHNIIASGSALYPSPHTGKPLEKWYLKYIRADVFLIINALNNLVMTGKGNEVTLEKEKDNSEDQYWKFDGVENDYDGYALFYRIFNNGNSSKH